MQSDVIGLLWSPERTKESEEKGMTLELLKFGNENGEVEFLDEANLKWWRGEAGRPTPPVGLWPLPFADCRPRPDSLVLLSVLSALMGGLR